MDNTTAIKVIEQVLDTTVKRAGLFNMKDIVLIDKALETVKTLHDEYTLMSGNFVEGKVGSEVVETENN